MSQHPGAILPIVTPDQAERALAAGFTPRILFDRLEPFLPLAVGYTTFYADGYSPSFPRYVGLNPVGRPPAEIAIEYAIWWDWDIQHLYELEHFWTFIDADNAVVHADGSWHGDFMSMHVDRRSSLHQETHPIGYAQPGKHALAASDRIFRVMEEHTRRQCTQSGGGGLLVTSIFEELLTPYKTSQADHLANTFLAVRAFDPAFEWNQLFDISADLLFPWPVLVDWIPQRIDWILENLSTGAEK